jgi:hypothetical protein
MSTTTPATREAAAAQLRMWLALVHDNGGSHWTHERDLNAYELVAGFLEARA